MATVLCFDISSGGMAAALIDAELSGSNLNEIPWDLSVKPDGSSVLDADVFRRTLLEVTRKVIESSGVRIDAISFSAFMHNLVLLDKNNRPMTPIFTWMDRRGSRGVERIRREFGSRFHALTGCRYHPMFPVFKLASLELHEPARVASAKSVAIAEFTGNWIEDHGTASASGMYDVRQGAWAKDILHAVELNSAAVLPLVERDTVVGQVTSDAASRSGIMAGTPVIAGSGDGFLANAGSGCDDPTRMAVTLGTSSSTRQVISGPVLDEAAGTFCYRAQAGAFLLGCASNNGGNVLDWARSVFGTLPAQSNDRADLPTFIPLLNGERTPDWNAALTASWHGITSSHTAADLASAVVDGVIFNLAHYAETLERTSGTAPLEIILSGNGFMNPLTSRTLASVVEARVLLPQNQGFASLRGAAICGFQALGIDVLPAIERIVANSEWIDGTADSAAIRQRYERYRQLRGFPL